MKILVTGGCGFVGSALVKELLRRGRESITRECDGEKYEITVLERRAESLYRPCVNFRYDVNFSTSLSEVLKSRYDQVYHFGASSSTNCTEKQAAKNLEVSKTIANYCYHNEIPLVYASSAAVYGNSGVFNPDNVSPTNLSPYAASKLEFDEYCKFTRCGAIGLRLFNVWSAYGEEHKKQPSAPFLFMRQLLTTGKILVGDNLEASRDWIHVNDVVRVALDLDYDRCDKIVNLGSGQSTSFWDVAQKVCREFQKPYNVIKVVSFSRSPWYQSYTKSTLPKSSFFAVKALKDIPLLTN